MWRAVIFGKDSPAKEARAINRQNGSSYKAYSNAFINSQIL